MMGTLVTEAIGDGTSLPVKPLLRGTCDHAALPRTRCLEAQWEPRGRARNGTALIAILHDPHLATRFADRSILLHRGWLTIDDPRETAMSSE
jgi:hypothetical protein